MGINPLYTQNGLKAYSQQLSVRSRMAKVKNSAIIPRDQIEISGESKNKYLANKISQEIVSNLTQNPTRNPLAQEILKKLGQEFGTPIDVVPDPGQGLAFSILPEKAGEPSRDLSPAENDLLRNKIFDIAQTIVYGYLSRGGI